uniref:Uncharacterized protein n=1 Tax=Chromera velia CCMP2878 TaxID=1169474 RepID=A0A0K6S8G1_9ALVE|eukprot:Cvel_25560.t2-p1 / transcript=Cvel_25560.t2 / gene=Cvel_25560 / organism=Chromera_velia_CCMP2878 / gene_product=hypothetical protein / transcript_product=hypothetical protein / location=Cvel_scaffold2912:2069-8837(+) / protein_length=262 / sequence_SO=supercontig / SO=protein_coding / is_pseudo=false
MGMTEQEWADGEVRNQAYLPQYQGRLGLTCFRATATAGLLDSCGATLSMVIKRLTDQSFLGPSQFPDRDAFFVLPWLQASKREYERAESATESVKLKAHHPLRQGWDAQSGHWWRAPHTQEQQKITDVLHRSHRVFLFSKNSPKEFVEGGAAELETQWEGVVAAVVAEELVASGHAPSGAMGQNGQGQRPRQRLSGGGLTPRNGHGRAVKRETVGRRWGGENTDGRPGPEHRSGEVEHGLGQRTVASRYVEGSGARSSLDSV